MELRQLDRLILFRTGKLSCIVAILAGAIVTLSLAPFDYWVTGVISAALLAWLLIDATPKQAAIRGWFYGLGLFGAGTSWVYVSIHVYGHAPAPLAFALTALFSAGLGLFTCFTFYVYARWVRNNTLNLSAGFAAIFVLGEWLRSWFLTGFPWLYLGYAHLDTPLAGWAPVGGVLAVSFVVALSGAYLAHSLYHRRWCVLNLSILVAVWALGWGLKHYNWVSPSEKGTVDIAMVQANIPQEIKWNRDQYWPTLNLYNHTSEPLWSQADIVIWPEAAIPGYYHNARDFLQRMEAKALKRPSTLITGLPYRETDENSNRTRVYNSIMAFGNGDGKYHKQRLVPFGEYVPLEGMLRGLIDFFDLPMSSFSPGGSDQPGIRAGNMLLAPFICYEIVYPNLVASWVPKADLLITISNDAWFGHSIGPLQHMQMAQMRALENGRYLIRATGSGISAIVNEKGQITHQSKQFERQVLTGSATAMTGTTPFSRFGSWAIVMLSTLICVAGFAYNRLRG
jgi:apolipoprotein N-acyltransferase